MRNFLIGLGVGAAAFAGISAYIDYKTWNALLDAGRSKEHSKKSKAISKPRNIDKRLRRFRINVD